MRLWITLPLAITAVSMTLAQSSFKQIVTTGGNPSLPFSPAVKAGGLIYVAGTLGTNASGAIAKGDVKAQTKQTLDNIAATLKAAGSSVANATTVPEKGSAILYEAGMRFAEVVAGRVYLSDGTEFPAVNTAYRTYLLSRPPARGTVKGGLAGADYLVEITMVAVKDVGRKAITT